MVSAGGLSTGDVDFVGGNGGRVGSHPGSGHDGGGRVNSLHGEGAVIGGVDKIGSINIRTGHVVTEAVASVVCPGGGIDYGAGRGQIAGSIGDGGRAIDDSESVIGDCLDGVAESGTGGDGKSGGGGGGSPRNETAEIDIKIGDGE